MKRKCVMELMFMCVKKAACVFPNGLMKKLNNLTRKYLVFPQQTSAHRVCVRVCVFPIQLQETYFIRLQLFLLIMKKISSEKFMAKKKISFEFSIPMKSSENAAEGVFVVVACVYTIVYLCRKLNLSTQTSKHRHTHIYLTPFVIEMP